MKLICPNCGAQYAVDDRVIPETGRDVQCSNCGHTWFQRHPDQDEELAEELTWEQPRSAPAARKVPERRPEVERRAEAERRAGEEHRAEEERRAEAERRAVAEQGPEPDAEAAAGPEPEHRPEPEPAAAEPVTAEEAPPSEAPAAPEAATEQAAPAPEADAETAGVPVPEAAVAAARPKVDRNVLSVLREEAEREQAARRAESGPPEYQPDLGVPSPETARHRGTAEYAREAPRRPAKTARELAAAQPRPPEFQTQRVLDRRKRLPDVDQITSTLEPADADSATGATARGEPRRRRGARIGYGLAFLAFGLATLVYTRSERIATAVPQTAETLGAYVANVDAGRQWLNGLVRPDSGADSDG